MRVNLNEDEDRFKWNLTTNGNFTVRSLYLDIMNGHTPYLRKYLWKLKVPLKVKKFMWFLNWKVLLTKYNLVKTNWTGCKKCSFCSENETVEHFFISCPFVKDIWRLFQFTFKITLVGNWLSMYPFFVAHQIAMRHKKYFGGTLFCMRHKILQFCGARKQHAPQKVIFLWRTGPHAPQKVIFLWHMGSVRHRKSHFCGAPDHVRH